jgi:hypothetical protein
MLDPTEEKRQMTTDVPAIDDLKLTRLHLDVHPPAAGSRP